MRTVVYLTMLLIAVGSGDALAEGAISLGDRPEGGIVIGFSANQPFGKGEFVADRSCQAKGGQGCSVLKTFFDGCLGFAYDDRHVTTAEADTPSAVDRALADCNALYGQCHPGFAQCDGGDDAPVAGAEVLFSPTVVSAQQTDSQSASDRVPLAFALPAVLGFVVLSALLMRRSGKNSESARTDPTFGGERPPPLPGVTSSTAAAPEPLPKDARDYAAEQRIVTPPPVPMPVAVVRDTAAALTAMQLALAFIDEVKTATPPNLDDKAGRREHLNTLALATDQLRRAEAFDPDAVLEGHSDDDIPFRYTLSDLKAEALFQEGLTHRYFDTGRAVPALVAAGQLNPTNVAIFYMLGVIQSANRNKAEAVAALQRALELAPNDIQVRKELIRAEAMSGAEIATYRVTRAGERIYDAGIATANAGIKTWNVFATVYNIITLPIRIPIKIAQKAISVLNYIVHG